MRQLFLGALLALASCAGERWSVVERDAKIECRPLIELDQ